MMALGLGLLRDSPGDVFPEFAQRKVVTSTLLSLFVVPALSLQYGKGAAARTLETGATP